MNKKKAEDKNVEQTDVEIEAGMKKWKWRIKRPWSNKENNTCSTFKNCCPGQQKKVIPDEPPKIIIPPAHKKK